MNNVKSSNMRAIETTVVAGGARIEDEEPSTRRRK